MSSSQNTAVPTEFLAQLQKLQTENKTLLADNPKRLKNQIKRLQEESRDKNREIAALKAALKKAQQETIDAQMQLGEAVHSQQSQDILDKPYWESADKSWAVFLEIDRDNETAEPDYNLRLLDRKSSCTKIPHMNEDDAGTAIVTWPRMRTIPKEVKEAIEEMVGIK